VAARVAQGMGAALVTPSSLALLQSGFVEADRARAVGSWSGLTGLAAAVGPFVGGWFVDGPGWRWAFLINLPVLVVAVAAARVIPESRDPTGERRFDVVGSILAVATLAPVTWALTRAGSPSGLDGAGVGAVIAGSTAGAAFVVRQRRISYPLVPPVLFRSRDFTALNATTFVLYGALETLFVLLVYQLQVTAGWSGVAAGAALLPATLLMLVGSSRSGALAVRIGPRLQLVVGPLLVAAGLLWLSQVDADARWSTDVLPGSVVFGLGLVTFVAPLTASVMASVDDAHVSTASGVNNAVARTGGLLAIAVIPVVAGLSTAPDAAAVSEAFQTALWITAGLALTAAVVAAVGLRRPRVRSGPRDVICPVDGPPLQPDPARCPVP